MQTPTRFTCTALGVVLASIALVGCNKPADNRTAGQVVDGTIAKVEQKATEMKDQAAVGLEKAEVKAKAATDTVGSKVADAVITTEINAELAKDSRLSALRINVDTADGKVSLSGAAPDAASKERATQLAAAVKGVASVDNRLTVMPDKM